MAPPRHRRPHSSSYANAERTAPTIDTAYIPLLSAVWFTISFVFSVVLSLLPTIHWWHNGPPAGRGDLYLAYTASTYTTVTSSLYAAAFSAQALSMLSFVWTFNMDSARAAIAIEATLTPKMARGHAYGARAALALAANAIASASMYSAVAIFVGLCGIGAPGWAAFVSVFIHAAITPLVMLLGVLFVFWRVLSASQDVVE